MSRRNFSVSKKSEENVWESRFFEEAAVEVKAFLRNKPSTKELTKLLQVAGRDLVDGSSDDTKEQLVEIESTLVNYLAARGVLECAVRHNVSSKVFSRDLEAVGMESEHVQLFAKFYEAFAPVMVKKSGAKTPGAVSVTNLRWRVDVTISTSQLSRVMRPSLILEWTLSDGRIETMECSVDTFHELRYAVAKAVKSVHDLKAHPTLQRASRMDE